MRLLPLISLAVGLGFAAVAVARRRRFAEAPYWHFFVYLHLAAVGLHQFEEYGFPGGFRDYFAAIFPEAARAHVPGTTALELVNVFGLTVLFGTVGVLGTTRTWLGLALLFVNSANGFFHLVYTVTRLEYCPGVITGTCLYMRLALLAARHAVRRDDVSARGLLFAFGAGTAVSFAPFLQVWSAYRLS